MTSYGKWLAGAAMLGLALGAQAATAKTTIIHADRVVTDPQSPVRGQSTVIVTDGRIVSIEDGFTGGPEGAEMVHLAGKTLVAGLIDLHVHLGGDPSGDWWREAVDTDEWGTIVAAKNARLTARAGFTTVREAGGNIRTMQAVRDGIARGWIAGPRIVAAGAPLSTIGGHGDVHGFRPEVMEALEGDNTCTGAAECAAVVRANVRDGSQWIKFHATGGVLSQGDKSLGQAFTDEEMKSIIGTAHDLGIEAMSHAHADAGIRAAVRAGVDTIEHGTFTSPATAKEMKARGTVLVPTLLAFKGIGEKLGQNFYSPAVEAKIRMTLDHVGEGCRNARAAGVTVAFGTDSGVTDHGRNAEEFALLEDKCGMSPREALASATTVAARVLGMEGQIGRIAPGSSADIIAVDGDPTQDARVLEKVEWVMSEGRVVD
jgi:imidazolonepropionase-like amidohydrolase